jgi:hypothetical protein
VEAVDGKIVFTKGDKVETEKLDSSWAVGPTIVPMLARRWDEVMRGDRLKIRLASWERQETIGFELFKDRVENGHVFVKMKPSNFLISALVNPIYFEMPADGKSLFSSLGRVVPKRLEGSKLKDLDAEVVYEFK